MTTLKDITNCSVFAQGVARFSLLAKDARTGVQAWRRSYDMEPWRDCIEIFIPQGGKYYPESAKIARRIPANSNKATERIDFYLKNGLSVWYEGDEPKSILQDEDNEN